jgi:hypothetical protein
VLADPATGLPAPCSREVRPRRYNSDGTLDANFGGDGKVATDP